MKKGITFYIDDDVDMIAFCGTLCTQVKDRDIRGVTMVNFSGDAISECSEWYVPVKGKAEPYQSEIPTGSEVLDKIRAEIDSPNRGTCDYFIVDRIEEIIDKYKASPTGAESEGE